jgi:hypothetical protein
MDFMLEVPTFPASQRRLWAFCSPVWFCFLIHFFYKWPRQASSLFLFLTLLSLWLGLMTVNLSSTDGQHIFWPGVFVPLELLFAIAPFFFFFISPRRPTQSGELCFVSLFFLPIILFLILLSLRLEGILDITWNEVFLPIWILDSLLLAIPLLIFLVYKISNRLYTNTRNWWIIRTKDNLLLLAIMFCLHMTVFVPMFFASEIMFVLSSDNEEHDYSNIQLFIPIFVAEGTKQIKASIASVVFFSFFSKCSISFYLF